MKNNVMIISLALLAVLACMSGLDAQCCGGCKAVVKKASTGGTISTGALAAILKSKAPVTLIDARQGAQEKVIPGARTLGSEALGCSRTLAKTVGPRSRLVITYCSGPKCSASTKMAAGLHKAGYQNVIVYKEGLAGWTKAMGPSCSSGSCTDKSQSGPACPVTGKSSGTCPSTRGSGDTCPVSGKSSGTCTAARDSADHVVSRINTAGLKALVDARVPLVILDARHGKYDDGKRIPGAKALKCEGCVSSAEFLGGVTRSKNDLIVTYCNGGRCPLSAMLAQKIRKAGYSNVIVFKEGISDWSKAGFPTVKSEAACCGGQ